MRAPAPARERREIESLAARLLRAEERREPVAPLTAEHPDLAVEDAYRIQSEIVAAKRARGARVVGKKAGLTSQAIQALLGVHEPDYGHLLDDMLVADGGAIACSELILPRVEPEIAFLLARRLRGPGVDAEEVLAAARSLLPALEVIDSRIADWKICLADTIADNASCARVVLGSRSFPATGLDLARITVTLEKNGETVEGGEGSAVLGHPANAVAWLANKLAALGQSLEPGEIVLPGALCAAVTVRPGDRVSARFDAGLGSVSVSFI